MLESKKPIHCIFSSSERSRGQTYHNWTSGSGWTRAWPALQVLDPCVRFPEASSLLPLTALWCGWCWDAMMRSLCLCSHTVLNSLLWSRHHRQASTQSTKLGMTNSPPCTPWTMMLEINKTSEWRVCHTQGHISSSSLEDATYHLFCSESFSFLPPI